MTHSLVFHIVNTAKRVQKSIDYKTSCGDLTFTEASTLVLLAFQHQLYQSEIANHLYLESASVVNIIDRLEGLGLLKRASQDEDRRKHTITLTEMGEKIAEEVQVQMRSLNNLLRGEMSHDEYKTIHRILLKLDDRLGRIE